MIVPLAVSPTQMLPSSPPEAKKRAPSAENTTPMKAASIGTRVVVGVAVRRPRTSVTEKREAPLLMVAAV
jgi:hypothetical protein